MSVAAHKVIPINALAFQARVRMQSARHNAHYLHEQLGFAMTGFKFKNVVVARKLRQLQLDLVKATLVHPRSSKPAWRPPLGAVEFVELLAMLVVHWSIPDKEADGSPCLNAGERYRGIRASAQQIAAALGISKNQWARGPYVRDGHVVSRGGTREWLQHHRLIALYATTKVSPPGWTSRDGRPMKFSEDSFYIEPGPALLQILGMHRRRVVRNRRRVLAAFHDLGSKASGSLFSQRENILPPHRARPRARKHPLVRQCQILPAEVDRAGGGKARRPFAPDAPPEDRRHAQCSSPEPDGHDGRDAAEGGGELGASCQRAQAAADEAQTAAAVSALAADRGAAPAAPPDSVAAIVAAALSQLDPTRSRRELAQPVLRPPSPNGPELATSTGAVLDEIGAGDAVKLIARLSRAERKRTSDLERLRAKQRAGADPPAPRSPPPTADAPAPAGPPRPPIGALFGGDRNAAEREENERRRELAKQRARAEAEREHVPIADVDDGVDAGPGGNDDDGET